MKVHSKVGFHLGPGGRADGIGDYMRALDGANIPFMIKATDAYGVCYEAIQIANKNPDVDHTVVYRITRFGQGNKYDYDVPPYKDPKFVNDPKGGAEKHWAEILKKLPPEFNKNVWIEPINEVDKDLCDWLGKFAVHIANLAHRDGYRVSLFAWSSGEPEREGWETGGMLDYFRLCAQRPNQAAVALHEYSYLLNNIEDGIGYKIGRFQMLFDVCDQHNIARPTIHITEWGWTLNDVPGKSQAIKDIKKIGELYAKHPQIKGAAIWYLGPAFGGIAKRAQKLIKPVTEFTLSHRFDVPELDKPKPVPVTSKPVVAAPTPISADRVPMRENSSTSSRPAPTGGPPNARFIKDVTVPDDSRIPSGDTFTKTWRMMNTGDVTWQGFKLVHVSGSRLHPTGSVPVQKAAPGQLANVSVDLIAPKQPGMYFSEWRLQDASGNNFGDVVFTRIVSEAAPAPAQGISNSNYVADVSIPDDTPIQSGMPFTKTWRVRNSGTRTWGKGFVLSFIKGNAMTDLRSVPLPAATPGEVVEISIPQIAPSTPGTHFGDWKMQDEQGNFFGEVLFLRIVATPKPVAPQPTPTPNDKQVTTPTPVVTRSELQTGMNINPDAPHSNPLATGDLRGMDWVRWVFKLDARVNVSERGNINIAFAQYDKLVNGYLGQGTKSLIIINQETIWGRAPWTGNNDWNGYAADLANAARQIARRYAKHGEKIAYQIWNEGDKKNNPASVYVEPDKFAIILKQVADAIRAESPKSTLVFNGMATGPGVGINYLRKCLTALGGRWPIDAIGIHPYTRWATRAPFDWGNHFGTLGEAFDMYRKAFPDMPFWITEIGVADDNEIGSQHYADIADYFRDVYSHVSERHTDLVPVLIWFAWSDFMRNAGMVDKNGRPKAHVFDAFEAVRDREILAKPVIV